MKISTLNKSLGKKLLSILESIWLIYILMLEQWWGRWYLNLYLDVASTFVDTFSILFLTSPRGRINLLVVVVLFSYIFLISISQCLIQLDFSFGNFKRRIAFGGNGQITYFLFFFVISKLVNINFFNSFSSYVPEKYSFVLYSNYY